MRQYFYKSTIWLPIAFLCYILLNPVKVYIREIGLYLDYRILVLVFLVLTLLWLGSSSYRRACCNGTWTELLFYLAPIELFLILIFAQWHFVITCIIVTVIILLNCLFWLHLKKDELRHRVSKRQRRRYKYAMQKMSLLIVAVLCAVPCFMASFVFELRSPIYEAEEEIWEYIFSSTESHSIDDTAGLFDQYAALMNCFQESTWEGYSIQEKITVLQELVRFEAERLGVPSVPIKSERLGIYTLGQYDWDANEIWIDLEHLSNSSVEACISTTCHEMFHCMEDYLITNFDWDSEICKSAYFAELRSWRENTYNYQTAYDAGYDNYANQPLEQAANAYAEEETHLILSHIPA